MTDSRRCSVHPLIAFSQPIYPQQEDHQCIEDDQPRPHLKVCDIQRLLTTGTEVIQADDARYVQDLNRQNADQHTQQFVNPRGWIGENRRCQNHRAYHPVATRVDRYGVTSRLLRRSKPSNTTVQSNACISPPLRSARNCVQVPMVRDWAQGVVSKTNRVPSNNKQ